MSLLVVSGGQTGADRGGLDAARSMGIPHRGWCPKGRRAEDGRIPQHYNMIETESSDYPLRTELNVFDSNATLIFVEDRRRPSGGSRLTVDLCQMHHKPFEVVEAFQNDHLIVGYLVRFLSEKKAWIINVAGSRESKVPGLQARVCAIMQEVLWNLRR